MKLGLTKKLNKQIETIKIYKEEIMIDKFVNKTCVYIAEIESGKFIKIGSTKNIKERKVQLVKLFGNCIFLEIFNCEYYREIEQNILNDLKIKLNLYKGKINNHCSQEVIKLTDKLNYEQVLTIVKKYINQMLFLTPEQILEKEKIQLEKEKIDLEKQKLNNDLILNLVNNNLYSDKIKDKIDTHLLNIFQSYNYVQNNIILPINKGISTIKEENDISGNSNKSETQNPNYNMIINHPMKTRKPKGKQIQKIDKDNIDRKSVV